MIIVHALPRLVESIIHETISYWTLILKTPQ